MFDKRLSVLKENSPGLFAGNKSICFINPRDLTDLAHFKIRNTRFHRRYKNVFPTLDIWL